MMEESIRHEKKSELRWAAAARKVLRTLLIYRRLNEMDLKPSVMAGTSMGSVIGALYAIGRTPEEILGILTMLSSGRLTSSGMLSKLQLLPPPFAAAWVKKPFKKLPRGKKLF